MIKCEAEYASLRSEIIALEEVQRNVWMYMYILFCSLFVLGLQWSHYLFLVTYVVVIPFQCVYNSYWWSITCISTYIRIFYEEENGNLNWESFHSYPLFKDYFEKRKKNIVDIIKGSGSIHLGILSTYFFVQYTLKKSYMEGMLLLDVTDKILLLLSIILLITIIIIKRRYNNRYSELEDIIREFKLSLKSN